MKLCYVANVRLPTEKAHGVQIMKMCEAFARTGALVELIAPTRRSPITEDPFVYYGVERNFTIRKLRVFNTVSFGRIGFLFQHVIFSLRAARYVKRARPDVVYSRDPLVLFFVGSHSTRVWEVHTATKSAIMRALARKMPFIVSISEGLRAHWIGQGIDLSHILVAHDGVDLEDFKNPESKEAARTRLGLPQHKKIALYIGRLDGWKGVDVLCEAANFLPQNILVALIGGEDRQIAQMQSRYHKVRFLGFHPYRELPNNQAAADVLILPNTGKSETGARFTSPLKLFSYMAAETPLIASDVPSIREVIDEQSAYMVKPDDPRALAGAIEQVLCNTEEGSRRARNAAKRVQNYSWNARAERILEFVRN
jgi:glycosyltransferase involved in cell wall biosynthesis